MILDPVSNDTPHFSKREMRCRCCGVAAPAKNVVQLARMLERIRDRVGGSITVLSAYRCKKHNEEVGGAPNSYHLKGLAADIVTKKLSPRQLQKLILEMRNNPANDIGGVGKYPGFTHVDCGPVRNWSK